MSMMNESSKHGIPRRRFLTMGLGMASAAAITMATGCGGSSTTAPSPMSTTDPPKLTDTDILNFALNLEYLEAEFYLRAVTGQGLSDADAGPGAGTVTGGAQVSFQTPALQQYATELANDEVAHVRFLRQALGMHAVHRPDIDLQNSFNAAAMAAGIGPSFNPFADENSFIVGAFTFEDVGVTAYHGAAPLLTDTTNLGAAAGIMATEAYHAANIRTVLVDLGGDFVTFANKISDLRATAGGGAEVQVSASTIVAADSNSIAFDRTTDQVLHIVYLNPASGKIKSGGFFPKGLNGKINSTTS